MSISLEGLKTDAASELKPFGINAVATAALTYGGQYLPKLIEVLSFQMPVEALVGGSLMIAAGGSLATMIGKTALSEEKMKNQFVKIALHALGAFAAAYAIPHVATLAGVSVTIENAMALFAASTIGFIVTTFLFSSPNKDDISADEIAKKSKDDFAKFYSEVVNKKRKLTNEDAVNLAKDRAEIEKTHTWDYEAYKANCPDGQFNFETYQVHDNVSENPKDE